MAAAYLYHIVLNQPFVDGNKRTGTDAAIVFLDMNGYDIEAEDESFIHLGLQVAQGLSSKQEVAQFFRARITKR